MPDTTGRKTGDAANSDSYSGVTSFCKVTFRCTGIVLYFFSKHKIRNYLSHYGYRGYSDSLTCEWFHFSAGVSNRGDIRPTRAADEMPDRRSRALSLRRRGRDEGDQVVHMAPPANRVSKLMRDLLH